MIDKYVLDDLGIKPFSYKKTGNVIVAKDKDKIIVFKKGNYNYKLFDYLKSRNYSYIPFYDSKDGYLISSYIDCYDVDNNTKAIDMIGLLALLHMKTTIYKDVVVDDIKKIYEDLNKKINYLEKYYVDLNEIINNEVYMSPSYYLLARNMSKIYSLFAYLKDELNNFYTEVKSLKKIRVCIIHNNIDLDHVLVSDNKYLISWDNAKEDLPIYDLYNFYKKYYNELSMDTLISMYEEKFPLLSYEKKLLFILISIPFKIDFDINEYDNLEKVHELFSYILSSDNIVSPYYAKDE